MAEAQGEPNSPPHLNVDASSISGRSNKSFKHLVRVLGPALRVHLGVARKAKDKAASPNQSTKNQGGNLIGANSAFDLEFPQLEEKMDINHLNELMTKFDLHYDEQLASNTGHVLSRDASRSRGRQKMTYGMMDIEQFKVALGELLGIPSWEVNSMSSLREQAEMLFRKIDRSHEGMINWDNFCTYIIMRFQEQDLSNSTRDIPFIAKPRLIRFPNIKETISKIMIAYSPTRYVAISKDGIIGVWNTSLELMRTIDITTKIEDDTINSRRRTKLWVTDAVCMFNVHKLAVASTSRDISFFDMSTPTYNALFHLCALPQVPMCLVYNYDKKNKAGKSMLLFGTDRGDIHILIFHTPIKGLFEKPFKKSDTVWKIFFSDLSQHSALVSHTVLQHVHSDWVRRMTYLPENEMLISCSNSSKESLVFRSLDERKRKTYVFRVSKSAGIAAPADPLESFYGDYDGIYGIDCFDYSKEKSIIATGGVDHVVRLWDPYVTLKPVAILKGHQACVIDVAVHEELNQVFSYSKDGLLKSWHITDHTCVQSIAMRLPFNSKSLDHGAFPFFMPPKSHGILVISIGDCFAELRLGASTYIKTHGNTHSRPLCSALYNPAYKQVITGSEDSEIIVWDIESGKRMLHLKDVHDGEELSCMALDGLGERLITGARDGSTNIWNLTTGLLEKKLEPYEEAEITGIIAFPEREQILTVGWSRKLLIYNDSLEGGTSTADANWFRLESHADDILSASYYPPNLIATSSFDGGIFIWSLEREKIFRVLRSGKHPWLKQKILDHGLVRNNENDEHFPVQNVLFLTNRLYQESSVLVSTERGKIEFWPVFGVTKPSASFHAGSTPDATILSIHTDKLNNYLISGDSKGVVVVWDIKTYCNVKTFREVVDQVLNRRNGSLIPTTNRQSPVKFSSWRAHIGSVISVQFVAHDFGSFVVSGSTDGSVKLWTLNGTLVGMFAQKVTWDIYDEGTYQAPLKKKRRSRNFNDMSRRSADQAMSEERKEALESRLHSENWMSPNEEKRPYSTSVLPAMRAKLSAEGAESVTKDVQLWTKTDYYRSRTMIIDNRNDSWSILGDSYNESFRRRMNDRKGRRNHFSQFDGKYANESSAGANVSPFKSLYIPETNEFELPQGLPVTPRMTLAGCDPYKSNFVDSPLTSGPQSLSKMHEESLPPLT